MTDLFSYVSHSDINLLPNDPSRTTIKNIPKKYLFVLVYISKKTYDIHQCLQV